MTVCTDLGESGLLFDMRRVLVLSANWCKQSILSNLTDKKIFFKKTPGKQFLVSVRSSNRLCKQDYHSAKYPNH